MKQDHKLTLLNSIYNRDKDLLSEVVQVLAQNYSESEIKQEYETLRSLSLLNEEDIEFLRKNLQ